MDTVAYSPDGKSIAAGKSMYNAVFVYDASTLKRTGMLLGKDESSDAMDYSAKALAYSRDGTLLATPGIDHSFVLWDATTGRESLRIPQLEGALDVAFSPTSDLLAVARPGKAVILWDVAKGKPRAVLKGHVARTIAFSPDGKLLAGGGDDGMVILWSVDTTRRAGRLGPLRRPVRSVSFSGDARMLATCDGEFQLWELDTAPAPGTLSQPAAMPSRGEISARVVWGLGHTSGDGPWGPVVFSPDGKHLAVRRRNITFSGDYEILLLDVASRKTVARIPCQCFGMAFSPDGTRLVIAGPSMFGSPLRLWDVNTGKEIRLSH